MGNLIQRLESFYPTIASVEHSINQLNSLDLSTITVPDLKILLNAHFPITNFGETTLDSRYELYRVRRNINNEFDNPYKLLEEIGIRPANGAPIGRANNKDETIFYCSLEEDLALFESCQSFKGNQRIHTQNFTMGVWKIKEGLQLKIVPIFDSVEVHMERENIRKASLNSEKLISTRVISEKQRKIAKLISNFFAEQFAKSDIKSPNDYKISSFFSKHIEGANDQWGNLFDGILYPSVAYKYKADNVAIFPRALHKLRFIKSKSIICKNFQFKNGIFDKEIIREGDLGKLNELVWK